MNGNVRNDETFRDISAYVMQDDLLYSQLTVYETILMSAHFYLSNKTPLSYKLILIDKIIDDLNLKNCKDTIIGNEVTRGISGGIYFIHCILIVHLIIIGI